MRKLTKPQDILLLTLASLGDIFEEIRDPLGIMGSSYKRVYGFIPSRFKRHNFTHLVWRSLKTGHIEKVIKDGVPYLRLTSMGKGKIQRDFSMLRLQNLKWDRKWRVVVFDIKEISRKLRDKLRKKLRELGFEMFQQSVYISPHDIADELAEFLEDRNLSDSVFVLEVSQVVAGDDRELANKIWGLDELNEEYQDIIDKISQNSLTGDNGRGDKLNHSSEEDFEKNRKIISEIWEEYLRVLIRDPFLPKELLPSDWKAEKARKLIRERFKSYRLFNWNTRPYFRVK